MVVVMDRVMMEFLTDYPQVTVILGADKGGTTYSVYINGELVITCRYAADVITFIESKSLDEKKELRWRTKVQ